MGTEALTYNERRALGFGTVRERVGKDSMGNYYDCCLTLQPVTDPVATPDGYLFSREAIVENLLQQKKLIKKRIAAYEAQQAAESQKEAELAAVEAEARLLAFDRQNHCGASKKLAEDIQRSIKASAEAQLADKHVVSSTHNIKTEEARLAQMRAFWLPSKTPEADARPERPDAHTLCPASGKRLRLKDLIPVRFTPVPEGERGTGRYMDPLTRDAFTNAHKLVLLRPTGDVLLKETYERLVKPDGVFQGKRVRERDAVELQTGGTGFAAHDADKVQATKHWTLGPGSGLADLRGQHRGPQSRGGLVFMN